MKAQLKRGFVHLRNQLTGLSWLESRLREQATISRPPEPPAIADMVAAIADAFASRAREVLVPTLSRKSCPICCETFAAYRAFNGRERAQCPMCGALERHRLFWLYLIRETSLFKGPATFLHFAAHDPLRPILESTYNIHYKTAFYEEGAADGNVDIQDLPYADNTFDYIYCSHVLEHVPDDAKAMAELQRVIRPGGQCFIMIPLRATHATYEDPSITAAEDRERHFGQWDHLRFYGKDVMDRLSRAGFSARAVDYYHTLSLTERGRYSLRPEPIFVCTK